MGGSVVVCSVATRAYLPRARTMVASFLAHMPGARGYVLVVDPPADAPPTDEPFEVIALQALEQARPWIRGLRFQYSAFELCSALKPHVLEAVLDRTDADAVVFLDSDIFVTAPLDPLWRALDADAIVLTPHLLWPPRDASHPALRHLLSRGVYNSGCIALRRSSEARAFVDWWRERLRTHCIGLPREGPSGDQKWIDLVPSFFPRVGILRDPGANVAHWNLEERALRVDGEHVRALDGPARFVHFSGFDVDRPAAALRHRPDLGGDVTASFATLAERYAHRLIENGEREARRQGYGFARFSNGVAIPAFVRRMYQDLGDAAADFGDPFDAGAADGFWTWLREPADGVRPALSRFLVGLHAATPALRAAYPAPSGRDRFRLATRFARYGRSEFDLDPVWFEDVRHTMATRPLYRLTDLLRRLRR